MSIKLIDQLEIKNNPAWVVVDSIRVRGTFQAGTTTERNALDASVLKEGMRFWTTDDGNQWVRTSGVWVAVPAAGAARAEYYIVSGEQITDLVTTTPQAIGAVWFDPNTIVDVSTGRARHVTLDVLLESSTSLLNAVFDIYDISGISSGGTPGVVTGSLKQTTNMSLTRFTQSLDAVLGSITTAGLLEARLSVQTPGPAYAVCKQAKLIVTWD